MTSFQLSFKSANREKLSYFQISLHCESSSSSECTPKLTKVNAPEAGVAVSLNWDDCTQSLYYVDIFASGTKPSIFRYDVEEDKTYSAYIIGKSSPAFILPINSECSQNKNHFAIGLGHYVSLIEWDGKSSIANFISNRIAVELDDPNSNLAISRQSETGIFYVTTLSSTNSFCSGPLNSSVYLYTQEKGLKQLFGGVRATTGIAFDEKAKMLYHVEGCSPFIIGFRAEANGYIRKFYKK